MNNFYIYAKRKDDGVDWLVFSTPVSKKEAEHNTEKLNNFRNDIEYKVVDSEWLKEHDFNIDEGMKQCRLGARL